MNCINEYENERNDKTTNNNKKTQKSIEANNRNGAKLIRLQAQT